MPHQLGCNTYSHKGLSLERLANNYGNICPAKASKVRPFIQNWWTMNNLGFKCRKKLWPSKGSQKIAWFRAMFSRARPSHALGGLLDINILVPSPLGLLIMKINIVD